VHTIIEAFKNVEMTLTFIINALPPIHKLKYGLWVVIIWISPTFPLPAWQHLKMLPAVIFAPFCEYVDILGKFLTFLRKLVSIENKRVNIVADYGEF
jgi:hypothetical protein